MTCKSQILPCLFMGTVIALSSSTLLAQEDVNSPPPPLQWPTDVSAHPGKELPFQVSKDLGLRATIEQAANAELCKILMKDANMPVPNEATFTYDQCPASIKAKINAREGVVAWEDGARPTECGRSCVGAPFMSQTQNTNRPNARYAMVYGNLTFQVDLPGPNRDIGYGLEIDVTCDVPGGSRDGIVNVTSKTDGPVADDPGILESIINFLVLPLEISQRITDGINKTYGVSTTSAPSMGPCSSIGANASPPADWKFDSFTWDVPSPRRRPPIPDVTTMKPTATIYFDRIFRNQTIQSNPSTGPLDFTVYINGRVAHIPRNGSITLAPGASFDQKICTTVPMDGLNSLHLIFADNLGGGVWSQFAPTVNFGAGGGHKMTTGRTVVLPARRPGDKPTSTLLREFELAYPIESHGAPTSVAPGPAAPVGPGRVGGVRPRPPAGIFTPGGTVPDSACTKI